MKKTITKVAASVLTLSMLSAVALTGCSSSSGASSAASASTPASSQASSSSSSAGKMYSGKTTIGQSSWIGFAPLVLAQEKGFFKNHGADVEVQSIESKADSKSALAAGRIQGISTTVDTHVMNAAAGLNLGIVLALDTSDGGDGIISKKELKTVKDLAGKTVALDTTGGADYFWFQYLLQKEGMSLKDIKVQSMGAGDAGAAFVAGKVDAAVTWQPWLSKAEKTSFGHTLRSSKEDPGIIVDAFGMSKDFIDKYPGTVQAIVDGWYDALDYMKSNPDDAYKIMSAKLGMTAADFKAEMPDVKFYDKAGNVNYFGTKDAHGKIYDVAKLASDLWVSQKLADKAVNPDDVINGSFVAGSSK